MKTIKNIDYLFVFILGLFSSGILFMHRLETGGDNLDFLLLARSIQAGRWSDALYWLRPAGYSALIALLLKLIGCNLNSTPIFSIETSCVYVLKAFGVLLYGLASMAVYGWARQIIIDKRRALIVAVLFACNQQTASWAAVIGAETLFMLLAFTALCFWEIHARKYGCVSVWLGLFIFSAVMCMYSKHQGLMMGAAFGLWVLARRIRSRTDWVAGAVLGVFFMFSVGMMIYGNRFCLTHVVAEDPYGMGVKITWGARLASALSLYVGSWPELIVPKLFGAWGLLRMARLSALSIPIAGIIILLLGIGLAATLKEKVRPSHFFGLAFYVMLLGWPDFLLRYLMPILPIGLWFFVEGLQVSINKALRVVRRFDEKRSARMMNGAAFIIMAWALSVNAYAGVKNIRNMVRLRHEPPWAAERYRLSREEDFADYMEACAWLREGVASNAVVFSRKAAFAELASGKSCRYYSAYVDSKDLWAGIEQAATHGPTYIVRDTFDPKSTYGRIREQLLVPALESNSSRLELIRRFDSGTEIYRLRGGK